MSQTKIEAGRDGRDARARAFIDEITEINRQFGMGGAVSEETYQNALDQSRNAYAGLSADD